MMPDKQHLGKFELLLESIGDDGLYQQLLLWLFFAPLNFLISWVALGPILLTSVPDHWCNVPGKPLNIDQGTWINLTVPREADGSLSKCLQYNMSQFDLPVLTSSSGLGRENISCQGDYSYDTTDFESTLATRHNWVCGQSSTVASWLSVGVAGNVVGTLFLNPLSDILGRRWLFLVSAMMHAVFSIARVYVTPFWLIMLTQLVASTAFPPVLEIALILVYELVDSTWRSRVTSIGYIFWALGTCALAMVAYFARTDRALSLVIGIPFLVYLPLTWIIPESSRWLLARSKLDAALKFLLTIAKVNKKAPPRDIKEKLQEIAGEEDAPHRGAIQLLQTPTLRLRTFLLTTCYVLNNLFYYGLAYNTANMSGNVFMNFFLQGVVEIPSNLVAWWASLNIGRRWSQSVAFLLGGVTVSFVLFFGASAPVWVNVALLTVSKFFISISFLVVYLQMAELYPTTHCGTGVGVASVAASIMGITAPYIAYSAKQWWGLPYVIMLVLALGGCAISSFVPETLGAPLPQTLDDAENFLTGVPYFSYRGRKFWRRARGRSRSAENGESQGHTNPIQPVDKF